MSEKLNYAQITITRDEIKNIEDYACSAHNAFVSDHMPPEESFESEEKLADFVSEAESAFVDHVAEHFGWKSGAEMLAKLDEDYYKVGDGGGEAEWRLFQWFSDPYFEMLEDDGEE